MNQQEQEFLREKQKILKSMPDSVAFSREEAKFLETITEELLEYKKICSLSELKMLCEDAERYAALDDALFLYSEERSEKNCLTQEILDTLTNITKRYKNKNKESEEKTMNINIVNGRGLWRGVTIETKEVVEGYYVYDLARNKSVIYKNESIAPGRGTILKPYDVLENTLCQCTGKRDRNGKYIFAFDILQNTKINNAKPEVVLWDDKNLQWVLSNDYSVWENITGVRTYDIHAYRKLDIADMSGLEIVGNKMEKDWEHVKDEPDAYYTRE